MTDFNMWTWNSRVFPGIDPLPVRLGDRVRVRIGNLTMTNHPIHMHGHHFAVTLHRRRLGARERAAGRRPRSTCRSAPSAPIEFVADNPGDWALHCHKSHHTMNAMGHDVRNFIGAQQRDLAQGRSASSCRTTCRWASAGMAEMGEMEMPMPDNTLPMMTGFGAVRADRDGRHVHGGEGPRGTGGQRLQGSGLVQAPAGNRRLRDRQSECAGAAAADRPGGHQPSRKAEVQGRSSPRRAIRGH